MKTPVVFINGDPDPFVGVPLDDRSSNIRLFYATDRVPTVLTADRADYSSERSPDLRVGFAGVKIGRNDLGWNDLREQSLREHRGKSLEIRVAEASEYGPLWTGVPDLERIRLQGPDAIEITRAGNRYAQDINHQMAKSQGNEIFIFLHGYKNNFDQGLEISAQFWHYLGRQGAFISYSWPSGTRFLGYAADKASAAYSARNFRLFLVFLARRTQARRINILAHSAGSPIVISALRHLRLTHFEDSAPDVQHRYRIGRLLLAAPDMDLMLFRNCFLDGFLDLPEITTIYASSEDKALTFSERFFKMTRVGSAIGVLSPEQLENIRARENDFVIDVGIAQDEYPEWFGHGYFRKNPWVSSDVIMSLRSGLKPSERGLVPIKDGALWSFSEDYPVRVKRAAKSLSGVSGDLF